MAKKNKKDPKATGRHNTVVIRDMVYGPLNRVNKKAVKKLLHIHHFNNKQCRQCEYKDERPCDTCMECPAYAGLFKFYKPKTVGSKKFLGIARGREDIFEKVFGKPVDEFKVVDKRVKNPFKHKLKFNLDLYDYQIDATSAMMEHRSGILDSKPRTGKTIMAIKMVCELKQKTLILAHQDDLIRQFYNSFYGIGDSVPKATNAQELLDKHGYEVVKIVKNKKDFKSEADVLLCTYQKFISDGGMKLLKKVAPEFGTVITDEIHRGNADAYSKVLSKLYPSYMFGLTATVERKDGKQFICDRIIGPVRFKTKAKALTPKIIVHQSALKAKVSAKQWVSIIRALCRNNVRNGDIVKHVIKDVKAGHSVIIPATFRWYIDAMVEEINNAWMDEMETTDQIAEAFYRYPGKNTKEEVLNRARSGETKVTVAMRSMLTGVNVPRWSAMYEVIPINNPPNFEQETQRVCTPFEDKEPIIRFFVDMPCSVSVKCFLACIPVMKKLKYDIDKKAQRMIDHIQDQSGHYQQRSSGRAGVTNLIGRPGQKLKL